MEHCTLINVCSKIATDATKDGVNARVPYSERLLGSNCLDIVFGTLIASAVTFNGESFACSRHEFESK